MSEPVENTEVLIGDSSTAAEQDNVTQQTTTSRWSTNGSKRKVANKVGLNQLSFKKAQFQAVAEDTQNVYELCEKHKKYTNKYIGIFVQNKVWRTVFWFTTQYPQISINSEKWINSSKSYWKKKKKNLELGVDEIMEKAQQKALSIMGPLSRL